MLQWSGTKAGTGTTKCILTLPRPFPFALTSQTAGMDSGFGAEDGYNLYDTRLFEGAGGRDSVYRPRNNAQASPFPPP